MTRVASTIAFHPAWYQLPLSIIGELLLWTPPVPRDTFLEENIIALVFAIVGVGSSFGGGKRLMFEANRLVPGLVVVLVCWVAMVIIVMLLLFLIEAVEKLNAFIVVHCVEIKVLRRFVLNPRVGIHAIDATPARWRGDAGSS